MNIIEDIINIVIQSIGDILGFILMLLPNSPFVWYVNQNNTLLSALNWLFPVGAFIASLQLYVMAVATYYAVRIILRWVKAVG